jgi:hypothetical protein
MQSNTPPSDESSNGFQYYFGGLKELEPEESVQFVAHGITY